MGNNTVKIFLSYHKNTPIYKSDYFQPIKVGGGFLDGAISDDTGDNISHLNPYYCELTGQYWVLKNYIESSKDDYIGFAHYRRLPDLINISKDDTPSVFGMSYSKSLKLFETINNSNLKEYLNNYDIILPCRNYMYSSSINPILKENEPNLNVYQHFCHTHQNDLLDKLRLIIRNDKVLDSCYNSEKSLFYNIYIMKKELLKEYLEWMFDILEKLGNIINGWEQDKYKRMAGFVSETLINVWLKLNESKNYRTGYIPLYMIDFEYDYIEKANEFHSKGMYKDELEVLKKLLDIADDKFNVATAMYELENCDKHLQLSEKYARNWDDFYQLALMSEEKDINISSEYYEKSLTLSQQKHVALSYLHCAEKHHDIETTKKAWLFLQNFELTKEEKNKYERFKKMYELIKG